MHELETSNRVSRILAHSEKSAVYMAGGYAPYLACTPIVALAGSTHAETMNAHVYQQIDDATAFLPVTKSQARVELVEAVLDVVIEKRFQALPPLRPVAEHDAVR